MASQEAGLVVYVDTQSETVPTLPLIAEQAQIIQKEITGQRRAIPILTPENPGARVPNEDTDEVSASAVGRLIIAPLVVRGWAL